MIEFFHWFFETPSGLAVFGAIILGGVVATFVSIARQKKEDQREAERAARQAAEAASVAGMARRDLVARTIERGDFLMMSNADFKSWMDLNGEHIFPHEREAMLRQRKARAQSKP